MTKKSSLQRLLRPVHIAVVGGDEAAEVIRQCDRIGFEGEIWAVNPRRNRLAGRVCYANIAALPQIPDATFIAVPRQTTIATVRELAQGAAGGAVCYASGFAEVGGEGLTLQQQLVDAMADMAIVGPNCYGLLNYLDGAALWPDQHGGKRVEQGVAIIAQSGNIGVNLTMQQRSLPLAYLITTGNQAGVTIPEYIEALIDDERITAIGLVVEALGNISAFSQAALKALAKGIPLVILKLGASELGSQIALSHTSSMTGTDQLYDILFERFGVMRVQTIPQFVEALKLLAVIGPLPSRKIASISCSGGEAGLLADMAENLDLLFPPLSPQQQQELHAVLGKRVALGNPLDYHTYIWNDEQAQNRCFTAMLGGEQDLTLKILDYPRLDRCDETAWIKTARAFSQAINTQGKRGAVVATMPENLPPQARNLLLEQGIAPMQGVAECLLAVQGAAMIYKKQKQHQEIQALFCPAQQPGEVRTLDEAQSKAIIAQYGIAVPQAVVCTAAEVVEAALEIGFPVGLKILSDQIIHKSDVGGVQLNLNSPEAVQQAVSQMQSLSDHFLVEAMAPPPLTELILGLTRDPQFGLALMIGAGGLFTELLEDHIALLFPIERADIEHALASLRIAPLLAGYRGQPPADTQAIIEAVLALARFAEAYATEIVEVDINPLFALPQGQGVLAVDATIRIIGEVGRSAKII